MKRVFSLLLGIILLMCTNMSAEAADNQRNLSRHPTTIVILGGERYLQGTYQDILNRYFIKCYSQYSYPTTYGWDAQNKFRQAYSKLNPSSDIQHLTQEQVSALLKEMDTEQVLFLNIHDRVYRQRRFGNYWLDADTYWSAAVFLQAVLLHEDGNIENKKFQYRTEGKYTPGTALQEAYTRCIRDLQKADIFVK